MLEQVKSLDVDLAEKWRKCLLKDTDLSKKVGTKKVVLRYKFQADNPIAQMKEEELKEFLNRIYLGELKECCRMLIDLYKA